MSRNLRIALGTATAISALVLSSTTVAQAATAQTANATAPGRSLSSIRPAAVTPDTPIGPVQISNAYHLGYCLNARGYNQQLDIDDCSRQSAWWTITPLTPIDSRGGVWAQISDHNFGYCMDAQDNATGSPNTNGDHVNSWPCDGAAQQRWYLWPLGGGTWMIVSGFNTNKVLDARTSGSWNPSVIGDPIQVWDHLGTIQQSWEFFGPGA